MKGTQTLGFFLNLYACITSPPPINRIAVVDLKKKSLFMHLNFFWWVGGEGLEGYVDGVVVDNFGISMTVQMVL